MNIFLFEEDLQSNALYFKNKDLIRFNKQIVESTQLMAASMLHFHNVAMFKKDGTQYTVDKILHHPACKWLLEHKDNHLWHIDYTECLLVYSSSHACGKTIKNAKSQILDVDLIKTADPKEYLCIANSDMSGLQNPTVFDRYKRHLENKHNGLI